jgi:hypothetical protein
MKKLLGYGIKYENETFDKALKYYYSGGAHIYRTKKEALKRVREDKGENHVQKGDIKIFKMIAEMD